uniref:Large ribosomal subunit protein uL23c n=1 Tax=Flabellia petiolata TaxID=189428 RepID=A0A386AX46_9CHLO|nr:ribosomal protein L23 [Flabellia petiolata]
MTKKLKNEVKWNQKIFDYLKQPVITDKTTKLIEQKQYTFDVDLQLTKKQIKKIFEEYYGIKIKSIKTFSKYNYNKKNSFNQRGKGPIPRKRVILRFVKNQEIPIFKNSV